MGMNHTDRRAVLIAVLVCAALAAILLPPPGQPVDRRNWRYLFRSARSERLRNQVADLRARQTLIAVTDTLRRRASSSRADGITLDMPADAPAPLRERLKNLLELSRAQIGSTVSVPVVVSLLLDQPSRDTLPSHTPGRMSVQYLMPQSVGDRACHVIVRAQRTINAANLPPILTSRASLLGPCAFIAAFGEPGRGIHRWLQSRQYDVARGVGFSANPAAQPGTVVRRAARDSVTQVYARYELESTRACKSGDLDACRNAVLSPRLQRNMIYAVDIWAFEQTTGYAGDFYLSDLVVEFGRERFRKFWSSNAEAEVAFEQVFGQSLAEWTNAWMRYRYGSESRGPLLPLSSAMTALFAVVLLVAGAVVVERRQVG